MKRRDSEIPASLVTPGEAGTLAAMTGRRMAQLAAAGAFPGATRTLGGRWLIPIGDVEAWLAAQTAQREATLHARAERRARAQAVASAARAAKENDRRALADAKRAERRQRLSERHAARREAGR